LNTRWLALAVVCASTAGAQGAFQGPGLLSRGAGDIGNRAGIENGLRFFAEANGIYDNGVQPFALDSSGNLKRVEGLYGVEADVGVYGSHQFRHAKLGLDYVGDFRHYNEHTEFDGSDHQLVLGYTYQKSQYLVFDFREVAGTSSQSSTFGNYLPPELNSVVDPTTLLFDNRAFYGQSGLDVSFIKSARTTFTFGGDGHIIRRQAAGLVGVNGYDLRGSVQHRISKETTVGVNYQHTHYDFPGAFGQSDINMFQLSWARTLGQRWAVSLQGGVYESQVQSLETVPVDPIITLLFGITSTIQPTYRHSLFPSVEANLTRTFRRALFTVRYSRGITPGNGVYLTSRQEAGSAILSYTGVRNWSFSLLGGYGGLNAVGQNLTPLRQLSGGTSMIFRISPALYLTARYDVRRNDATRDVYRRTASRASLGLSFSPGTIPLAFR
jgi:hypothetical protein